MLEFGLMPSPTVFAAQLSMALAAYQSQTRLVAYRPGAGTVVLGLFKFGYHRRWQVITAHGGKGFTGTFIGEIAEARRVQHSC